MATTAVGSVVVNSMFVAATYVQRVSVWASPFTKLVSSFKAVLTFKLLGQYYSCYMRSIQFAADALQAQMGSFYTHREKKYHELSRMVTNICLYSGGLCMHSAYSDFLAVLPNRLLQNVVNSSQYRNQTEFHEYS